MTFADWIALTRRGFRDKPASDAVRDSSRELFVGAARHAGRRLDRAGLLKRDPIWSREWDVCCVLDACRVDTFQQVASETSWLDERDVSTMWSVGSASPEWIDRTFAPEFDDHLETAAYITANPFSAKPEERAAGARSGTLPLDSNRFAVLNEVWRHGWEHDPISTVPPRTLTDRVIDVWRRREEFGVERVVVHYMQPHIPFRSRPEWFGERENLDIFGEGTKEAGTSPWKRVRDGETPRDEFLRAYRDNLSWVLEDVDILRHNLDADIALTSDHGNGIGEWGVWSHPPESPFACVRKVPWTVVRGRDLGEYEPDPGVGERDQEDVEDDGVLDRLAALGYREV